MNESLKNYTDAQIAEIADAIDSGCQECQERFVDDILLEGRLKEQFWQALNRRHPFREFNYLIHDCAYREDWPRFKQKELEEYVRRQLE